VIFEKSRGIGGRVATRRIEQFIFDTGATSIATRGMAIEAVTRQELDTSELVEIEKRIDVHSGLRVSMGDSRHLTQRFTYLKGINTLPKLLADGLTILREVTVEAIERAGGQYRMNGELFDAVVITAPIPQAGLLLWGLQEDRPLANASYRPCLSILLGYTEPTPDRPYWALLDPEQRHPLNWLSVESAKCPGRAPDGGSAFVAQLGPRFSLEHYDRPNEELVTTAAGYLAQLYGEAFRHPKVGDVKRWKYSQPETIADFDAVNPPGSTLVVAGDGVFGGHTESAFQAGIRAAHRLLGHDE
jgi:predicted NAD/FAD-dependent oxidoreductase